MSNIVPLVPPDRSPDAAPATGLPRFVVPTPLTTFVGRASEVREILALLDDAETRLVTLTGPGGVGKTRLALEVARRIERDFADGVCFVPLASVQESKGIPVTVAHAFGIREQSNHPLMELLVGGLRVRHLLLVLDNFEHLLADSPTWLAELLGMCPWLKVLVTSRTALGIGGEHRYLVPPLPVPDADTVPDKSEAPAVTLFAQRAHAARVDFTLDASNAPTVEELCRRLDGLPLAIELAAAQVTVLTPDQILSRLTDRFRLLTRGQRDAPARQQSMRDAVGWSYDLLTSDEQRLFRVLSVFVGGFTMDAAEVVGESDTLDVVTGVRVLVDASLLRMVDGGEQPRYVMLETIREFGLERLAASGEEAAARDRQVEWCLATARNAILFDPSRQLAWLQSLGAEIGNLRVVLHRLHDSGRIAEMAELVTQLRWFWYLTERYSEGLLWYERVLAQPDGVPDRALADALLFAGQLALNLGRAEAAARIDAALSMARESGDVLREAEAIFYLGSMAEGIGDYATAESRFHAARGLYEAAALAWRMILVDYRLGVVAFGKGELAEAARMLDASRVAAEAIGDTFIPPLSRIFLALIACIQGNLAQAAALIKELPTERATVTHHDRFGILNTVAVFARASGRHESAARLFGAASTSEVTLAMPESEVFERAATAVRRHLGTDAFNRAWEAGRGMRGEAIAAELDRVLTGAGEPLREPEQGTAAIAHLTPREMDVLKLMAEGLSNPKIADALFISRKTVANHLTSIFAKLGVESRTAAVGYAIRHELA